MTHEAAIDALAEAAPEGTQTYLEGLSPAEEWGRNSARRSLDELFCLARKYRSTEAYRKLLQFTGRLRFYSPFNAMLVHVQKPGATFVAPPHRWLDMYGRRIKASASPLVILQPRGPVMFVFDVSDTEAEAGAPPLPPEVERPFEVRKGRVGGELSRTIENAKRDGVAVHERQAGSQSAGEIRTTSVKGKHLDFVVQEKPIVKSVRVPLRYELLLNAQHSAAAKYATLVHELAHLYCGHLGTPNDKLWPNRRGLTLSQREFEAESVCYLVCERLGIENPSDEYLAGYQRSGNADAPAISLECVMKVAGLIEQMGASRLKARRDKEPESA